MSEEKNEPKEAPKSSTDFGKSGTRLDREGLRETFRTPPTTTPPPGTNDTGPRMEIPSSKDAPRQAEAEGS